MSLNRGNIIDRIQAVLTAHSTPAFTVITGEPLALSPDGSPYVCFWYLGDAEPSEGKMTLTNVMVMERFHIACFWHRRLEMDTFEAFETEIWQANRTLKAAFRADSTLSNEATDLDITDSQVDYGVFPVQGNSSPFYRTLEFDLLLKSLEEEAIAP